LGLWLLARGVLGAHCAAVTQAIDNCSLHRCVMAEWDEEGKLISWDVTKMEVEDLHGIIGDQRIGIDVLNEWFAHHGKLSPGYFHPRRGELIPYDMSWEAVWYCITDMDQSVDRLELAQVFFDGCASVGALIDWCLGFAAIGHNEDLMEMCLNHGANVDALSTCPHQPTALMLVIDKHLYYTRNDTTTDARLRAIRLLVSRGANLNLRSGEFDQTPVESAHDTLQWAPSPFRGECHAFLRDVTRAGGWRRFVNIPRKSILVLRELCLRGRATPPRALVKLCAPTTPTSIVWCVLKFWRSDREPYIPPTQVRLSVWPEDEEYDHEESDN
jgi:hypothetical protein